ncbi:MAG: DNA repair exonuclease [Clostridia bacterium]|nr:DNA repair exonuclease [Clostridia bacterium]
MKFVHVADIHFDMPFTLLSNRADMGEIRRIDQRKAFKKMIEYIKENEIPYLFIAGDLYEHEYIRESTIEYINNLFKEIPNTKIFITPGNHDPYLLNSYYNKYKWADNVKIFNSRLEKIETEDANIYGFGFDDFYCYNSGFNEFELENKDKLNILIMHSSLAGARNDEKNYNVISEKMFKEKGFDYVALGHIHKRKLDNNIVYPGSMLSLGFDELGEHGMVVGNIEKGSLNLEFIILDEKELIEEELDVSDMTLLEELIEKLNEKYFEENKLYKVIFVGKRNFEIDIYKIYKLIQNKNIIKIKDKTKIAYDLNEIANDYTLKGLFAKEILNEMKNNDSELLEKVAEIGLDILS